MRISDWSSDVCSSDLQILHREADTAEIGLITDDGVGERVAPEIVARIGTVETARQIELRLDARRQRAARLAGGEVQPVGCDIRAVEVGDIGRASGRERGWQDG